jgi:hypothetical protein
MILLYGEAERNSAIRWKVSATMVSNRMAPIPLERRLREACRLQPNMTNTGRPWRCKRAHVEDFLWAVEQSSGANTRRLARRQLISQRTVLRVLHDQLLHPIHVQHTRCDNLIPGMALWKQNFLTCALAADVAFEILPLWSYALRETMVSLQEKILKIVFRNTLQ